VTLRLLAALSFLILAWPAAAQERTKLGAIPDVFAITQAIEGDLEDEDEHIREALDAVEKAAQNRGLKLSKDRVIIRQVMGLKTFRSRVGYLIEGKAFTATFGRGFEVGKLPKSKAWIATGKGGEDSGLIKTRRRVLDELAKPGVKRLAGIEVIEIFHGDPADGTTPFTVYGPIR
jgi:hypothetical protein